MQYDITAVYYFVDEFCKLYEQHIQQGAIPQQSQRKRENRMSLSEMLTILICFQLSGYKCFKHFYLFQIGQLQKQAFPRLLSYDRFVQITAKLFMPLALLQHCLKGEETGKYIIDSTILPVCHNLRIFRHQTFEGLAKRGKSSMGWFFGFKLHIVMNDKAQIMAVCLTPGNISDLHPVRRLVQGLKGWLAADKGYISRKLFWDLFFKGLKLLHHVRANMKNMLMSLQEKLFLRKRKRIETLNGNLKEDLVLWHSRHRSPINAFVHLLACLVAYAWKTNKPAFKRLAAVA